jgi:hypothetical protein
VTEEDTLNRLRRKDFLEVFEMLTAKLNFTGGAAPDRTFTKYLLYAIIYEDKQFKVQEDLFPIIESAYWKPEEFMVEGQKRLDEAFAEVS